MSSAEDRAESIRQRLRNAVKARGEDVQFALQRYAAERFLHRLGASRYGLGDRSGTCIDPKTQVIEGKLVCVVSCQRSPEPVFLKWKGVESAAEGDFFVRSGPGTVKLPPDSAREYIRTRFAAGKSA